MNAHTDTQTGSLWVVTGFAANDLDDLDRDTFVHASLATGAMFRSEAGARAYIENELKEQTDELEAYGEDCSGWTLQWRDEGTDEITAFVGTDEEPEVVWQITRVDLAKIGD